MSMPIRTTLVTFLVLSLCSAGHAQVSTSSTSSEEDPKGWQHKIEPYIWIPGENGNVAIAGINSKVDVSISDAIGFADKVEGATILHYEGRKNRFAVLADIFAIGIADQVQTRLGSAEYDASQGIMGLNVGYLLYRQRNSQGLSRNVWAYGGARYSYLKTKFKGPLGLFPIDVNHDWVDMVIGGTASQQISQSWAAWLQGDVGGFGLGSSSDLTWQALTGLTYRLSDLWSIDFGWRWLYYNYETGSGVDQFKYDIIMSGPLVGFGYRF